MRSLAPRLDEQIRVSDRRAPTLALRAETPPGSTLVAHRYGRRDWFLRRMLAACDATCLAVALALALALAGEPRGHEWQEYLLYGLATLPAWVVLLKMYGLYERDVKRLSHGTLDDLPALFHALVVGCLLTWCYYALLAPARLSSSAILALGALSLLLVFTGRALARSVFVRLISPERVLLIGQGAIPFHRQQGGTHHNEVERSVQRFDHRRGRRRLSPKDGWHRYSLVQDRRNRRSHVGSTPVAAARRVRATPGAPSSRPG